jgi:anti-sigma factor RsiW
MTMHEKWTDQLSDYLDGELTANEQAAVAAHLRECAECTEVLNDLKRVIARAQGIEARPPQSDLWGGIAGRLDVAPIQATPFRAPARARRFAFTMPQLAAASLTIAAMSGGLAWSLAQRAATTARPPQHAGVSSEAATAGVPVAAVAPEGSEPADVETVSLADAQYDAAVADLERALKSGRGRLDPATIATVEHNLETIDHAIQQAREALAGDPANTYLSSHLVEARRRKLDLLRRAAALTSESD